MKIADLHDEHGMSWFRHAGMVFGSIYGIAGSLLVILDPHVAVALLAMVIACLVRLRLDYLNHAVAAAMILSTYSIVRGPQPLAFGCLLLPFLVFGFAKDYIDDKTERRDWVYRVAESMWYYPASTLVYGALTDEWQVFWVFLAYTVSYNWIKIRFGKASAR